MIDIIKEIPLFSQAPPDLQNDLASIAREQSYDKGEIIFSEGDLASGLYVVSSGRVKIFKLGPDGKEQILHIFEKGEPFGEVAVFKGWAFPAYAQAMERSKALIFPRQALIDLIKRNPDLALEMLAVLSFRLRKFTNLIEDLSLKEVPSRLAAYFLYLRDRNEGSVSLELDITKGQLASLLGTIPETLSRILAKMVKQELIDVDGKKVELLAVDRLEDLADAQTRL